MGQSTIGAGLDTMSANAVEILEVVKLSKYATTPKHIFGSTNCLDIAIAEGYVVPQGKLIKMETHLAIKIPSGYCGLLSGKPAWRERGLEVIQQHIREGENCQLLISVIQNVVPALKIFPGAQIAELVLVPVIIPVIKEVAL